MKKTCLLRFHSVLSDFQRRICVILLLIHFNKNKTKHGYRQQRYIGTEASSTQFSYLVRFN